MGSYKWRLTIVITHTRAFITPLLTTHESPSRCGCDEAGGTGDCHPAGTDMSTIIPETRKGTL